MRFFCLCVSIVRTPCLGVALVVLGLVDGTASRERASPTSDPTLPLRERSDAKV